MCWAIASLCLEVVILGNCKTCKYSRTGQLSLSPSHLLGPPGYQCLIDWDGLQCPSLLAVYRVRATGEPEYLAESLCCDNRNGHIIVKPTRLSLLQKSFKFRGAIHWNELPPAIRKSRSIGSFKAALKNWIENHVPRFLD